MTTVKRTAIAIVNACDKPDVDWLDGAHATAYALALTRLHWLATSVSHALGFTRSPIERALLMALIVQSNMDSPWYVALADGLVFDVTSQRLCDKPFANAARIECQAKIGKYRVDFLLSGTAYWRPDGPVRRLVIECDGHDFHDRTKEQAAHDRSRDRALMQKGYRVIRFTGSEIHRDAQKCADEALKLMWSEDVP